MPFSFPSLAGTGDGLAAAASPGGASASGSDAWAAWLFEASSSRLLELLEQLGRELILGLQRDDRLQLGEGLLGVALRSGSGRPGRSGPPPTWDSG